MYNLWGCTSIYRPLSYPFISLEKNTLQIKTELQRKLRCAMANGYPSWRLLYRARQPRISCSSVACKPHRNRHIITLKFSWVSKPVPKQTIYLHAGAAIVGVKLFLLCSCREVDKKGRKREGD